MRGRTDFWDPSTNLNLYWSECKIILVMTVFSEDEKCMWVSFETASPRYRRERQTNWKWLLKAAMQCLFHRHIYCCPCGWCEQLISWSSMNFSFFFLYSFFVFCGQESKFGSRWKQLAASLSRLPAAVLTEDQCTQCMKSLYSWGQGPVCWALYSRTVWREKDGSVSRSGPQEWWKDNSPPLLSLDLMQRQTICEQWHSQIGPKGYEWETSKPAHVSVTVKGFV